MPSFPATPAARSRLTPTGLSAIANNTLLDYNRLATNTMLAVQFELFMNITNLDDASRRS